MNLEIRHLSLLVAVKEEGSVTKAGNRLHLTQSAISHQLRNLEDRLRTRLFHRLDKKMVLTPAGERLYRSAQTVLDELKHAEEDVANIASERKGVVRISTQCYTCYNWLPNLLLEFRRTNPNIEVSIVVEATREPIPALLNGKLDIAIVNRKVHDRRLSFRPLFKDELAAILPANHYLASRAYLRPEDLAEETLIIHGSPQENPVFQTLLIPAGVTPKHVSQVQLTEAIIEMIRAGLGVGLLATWAVREHIELRKLHAVRLTPRGFQRQWMAATLKQKNPPSHVTEFIDLLTKPGLSRAPNLKNLHLPGRQSKLS